MKFKKERKKETSWCWKIMNEDMVQAVFDWISEMRAGNLRFIIEVPNISLPHLEAWPHIKAWSEKITFEIEAPASIRGNTVPMNNIILVTWLIEGPDNRGPDNQGLTTSSSSRYNSIKM